LAQPVKVAWPTWAFRPGTKQGSPPFLHRRRVAGEGGARELAPEVRVPIWCICSGGAHYGWHVVVKQVSGGEPATAGQRRGGGRQLGVCGATVSSGGGCYSDGGARRWSEVALDGKVASANEGGSRLGASTIPCCGCWLSDRLGVAQRRMRAVHGVQCLEQRSAARGRVER
jgi:hypothetical protein